MKPKLQKIITELKSKLECDDEIDVIRKIINWAGHRPEWQNQNIPFTRIVLDFMEELEE